MVPDRRSSANRRIVIIGTRDRSRMMLMKLVNRGRMTHSVILTSRPSCGFIAACIDTIAKPEK